MRTVTVELTFENDEDYFKFMDDLGCIDWNDVIIPSNCNIKVKNPPKSGTED